MTRGESSSFGVLANKIRNLCNVRHQPIAQGHEAALAPLRKGRQVSAFPDASWKGGYEIVELPVPVDHEPQYVIRNADQSSNRVAKEHELQEDLSERTRGQ